jgi:hypothetical protein
LVVPIRTNGSAAPVQVILAVMNIWLAAAPSSRTDALAV